MSDVNVAGQSDLIASLRPAIGTAERLAAAFTSRATTQTLDHIEQRGEIAVAALPIDDLTSLISDGHLVDIQIRLNTWRLHLRRGGIDGDVTTSEGPTAEAVEQHKIDALDRAIAGGDLSDIIALLQAHDAAVVLRIINNPDITNTHWIATREAFIDALASTLWVPTARQLTCGPTALLIDDLDDTTVKTQGLTIYGPSAATPPGSTPARRDFVDHTDDRFRRSRANADPYPSPLLFHGATFNGPITPAAAATAAALNRLTFQLIWALLATTSKPIAAGVHVTVSGARELDLDLTAATTNPDNRLFIDLYRWVALSPEIDRLYFAQQALTLAVVTTNDARTAAGPALRTAKSLYDLSRKNTVAEVMSARRSAREIALAAARSAATQARESAAKAIERTVLQAAAAAGIIIARLSDALSPGLTIGLLILVVVICVASAYITDFVALRSARDGLTQELSDLDRYRDTLSEEDIVDIKTVGAVAAARTDLNRARHTTWWTYGTATVALFIAIAFVAVNGDATTTDPDHGHGEPTPTAPTTTGANVSAPTTTESTVTTPTTTTNPTQSPSP